MPKQVRIFVSRKITLERFGKDAVVLHAGANLVDADVAEHDFVKAHMIEGASEAADAADAGLKAENAKLRKANDEGAKELRAALNRAEAAEAKVAELQAMVDAFTATADKK